MPTGVFRTFQPRFSHAPTPESIACGSPSPGIVKDLLDLIEVHCQIPKQRALPSVITLGSSTDSDSADSSSEYDGIQRLKVEACKSGVPFIPHADEAHEDTQRIPYPIKIDVYSSAAQVNVFVSFVLPGGRVLRIGDAESISHLFPKTLSVATMISHLFQYLGSPGVLEDLRGFNGTAYRGLGSSREICSATVKLLPPTEVSSASEIVNRGGTSKLKFGSDKIHTRHNLATYPHLLKLGGEVRSMPQAIGVHMGRFQGAGAENGDVPLAKMVIFLDSSPRRHRSVRLAAEGGCERMPHLARTVFRYLPAVWKYELST